MSDAVRSQTHPCAALRADLAALQAESWRSAYAGLMDAAFLEAPATEPAGLAAALAAEWGGLRLGREDLLLVAPGGAGPPEAFALLRGGAEQGARPYLDHLHVRPTHRGRGLGERLMRAAAARLRAQGRTGLWLWVLASNAGARRFYARLGALEEDRAILAPYGQRHPSLRLGWRGAEAMARLADGG